MRIFESSSAGSIAVVRDWYVLYISFETYDEFEKLDASTVKSFRLAALEVIAGKQRRFGTERIMTGYVKYFVNNNIFVTSNSTYLLVGEVRIVADYETASWDLILR